MAKSPAFQFYADNFLSGTADMSVAEVGVYVRLLCHQWSKGFVPNDIKKLARLTHGKQKDLESVLLKFSKGEDGHLRNERLENERVKQAKFSESRRANAEHRWSKANASASDVHPGSNALQSSSSDCSQNAIKKEGRGRPETLAEVVAYGASPQCGVTAIECERFWNHYESMGWLVNGNAMSDWRARLRNWKVEGRKIQVIVSTGSSAAPLKSIEPPKSKYEEEK